MLRSLNELPTNEIMGKNVLIRVDYNVPVKDGKVLDDTRIIRSLPTVKYLLEHKARLVICSHLGRPKGEYKPELSLKPVAEHLANILKEDVAFCEETVGEKANEMINSLSDDRRILLLENTRFNKGEKNNDDEFSKELSKNMDLFVSDAFGTVHRAHASTVGVTKYLDSYAGFLVEQEYKRITAAMQSPKSPSLALVGGAKVSTKLDVINNFLDVVDTIVVGGGMVYTFLKSQGKETGDSLVESDMVDTAAALLMAAENKGVKIILPVDFRLSKTFDEPILENGKAKIVDDNNILPNTMGLDIGPESEKIIDNVIQEANTIIWNGPMGVFEKDLYRSGTKSVAESIVKRNVETIIGGGDTAFALNLAGISEIPPSIHVSTGGGASLELMSGLELPGLECLKK